MSTQAANELGPNAVMCYFPWFPYYHRYQIGFDILVNSPDAQADPSVAGTSQRLIHVRLYFPDGFICNPANFDGMPHPPSYGNDVPHFLPAYSDSYAPIYQPYMHTNPHFCHQVSGGFPGPITWQEQRDARVAVYVENAQPGEFMVIDDTPYDVISQCNGCGGFHQFHGEPEYVQNKPLQSAPKRKHAKQSHKQSGHSHQHPSAAGILDQTDTSYAAPHTARERATTDRKSSLQEEDKPNLTQQMAGQHQYGTPDVVQGIQHINDTVTTAYNWPTTATITYKMSHLDIGGQNNDENMAQDNKKPDADPKVDMPQDKKKPDADPKVDMAQDENVAQDNKKPDADPKVDMPQDNKKPEADPKVDMAQDENVAQDNKKPDADPDVDMAQDENVSQDNKKPDTDPKVYMPQENKKPDTDPKVDLPQDNKKPDVDPKVDMAQDENVAQDNKKPDADPDVDMPQDNKMPDADLKVGMPQDNKKPDADPKVDMPQDNKKADADPKVDMAQNENVAQNNKKPDADPKVDMAQDENVAQGNKKPDADPKVDMAEDENVAQDNKKPDGDPKADNNN